MIWTSGVKSAEDLETYGEPVMRIKLPLWFSGLSVLFMASVAVAQPGGFPGGFPGGGPPGGFPEPGQIVPAFVQDQLKLTAEQKKQLGELQKEVDARLAAILTAEQRKTFKEARPGGGFGPPGGGGFGPPGGFGGFSGFGAAPLDDVKKQLDATDEEWKVIGTKLKRVIAARQVLTSVDSGTAPGFGGPPGGFGGGGTNIVSQARADLKAVIGDKSHSKADVDEKVAAVRKARQKAQADLDAAQKDLLQMLTDDQAAVLISLGYAE